MKKDLSVYGIHVSALFDPRTEVLNFVGGNFEEVFGCSAEKLHNELEENGLRGRLSSLLPNLCAGGYGYSDFAEFEGGTRKIISVCRADLTADGLVSCTFYSPKYAASRLGAFDELSPVGLMLFDIDSLKIYDIDDFIAQKLGIDADSCGSLTQIFTQDSIESMKNCFSVRQERCFSQEAKLFTKGVPMRYDISAVRRSDGLISCTVKEKILELLYDKYFSNCSENLAKASGMAASGLFKLSVRNDGSIVSIDRKTETEIPDLEDNGKNGEWLKKLKEYLLCDNFTFISNCYYSDGKSCRMQFDFYPLEEKKDIRIFLVFYSDVSDKVVTLLRYREMQERFEMLLEHTNDIIFSYDYKTDILELTDRDVLLDNKKQLVFENASRMDWGNVFVEGEFSTEDFVNGKVYDDLQIKLRHFNGEEYWYSMKNHIVNDDNGDRCSTIGTLHDITEEKKAQLELADRMKRDAMTGFLSKDAFIAESEEKHKALEQQGKASVMICARITNLAALNENVGILFGDIVLKNLAAQVNDLFGGCTVGRTGGNTLSVFTEEKSDTDERLKRLKNNFTSIYRNVDSISCPVLVLGAAASEQDDDADKMLFKVNLALMAAERSGEPYERYSATMEFLSPAESAEQDNSSLPSISASMDSITTEMCKALISTSDIDAAINSILALSGYHYKIKRAYIFERTDNPEILCNTYEWCAEGIASVRSRLQSVKIEDEAAMNRVFEGEHFQGCDISLQKLAFPSLYIMEEGSEECFEKLQFPIRSDDGIFGFIGFDSYDVSDGRSKPDLEQLSMLSGFLGSQLVKLRTQRQEWSENQIFRALIDHMNMSVYTIDPENYELLYSKWYDRSEEICGGKCYEVLKGRNCPCSSCPLNGLTVCGSSYSTRTYNQQTNSWQDITAFRIKDFLGRDVALVSCHEITDYNEQLAETDNLTSTLSFSVFVARAEEMIRNDKDSDFVIMYLNCRKLRIVNETFGYSTGNKLLIAVAATIKESMGETGICSRISADKFVVVKKLIGGLDPQSIEARIEDLRQKICVLLDGKIDTAYINFCVGIYSPDSKAHNEMTVEDMLDKSCTAAKAAESAGKSLCIYDIALREKEARIAAIEASMESAAANDEFKLYLQPKFSLSNQELKGAEALVRWVTSDGQFIMPDSFIPVFEQNRFITKLDFIMYEKTMQTMRKWMDDGKEPPVISVNVSRVHINDDQFVSKLIVLTEKYGIQRNKIELEVTETMLVDDEERMLKFVEKLHKNDFLVSIDDFGSGYSALSMLKNMDVDILKLDKSLLSKNHSKKEKLLIEGIVSIARKLNMSTVCEGVETAEQAQFLSGINCDYAQGYLYERPIPISDFEDKYIYGECLQPVCAESVR